MQELKWKVVGSNIHSCNFFLPNKHLYSGLEEPGLKIKTFSPDCIVPVPKPGLKGVENQNSARFFTSAVRIPRTRSTLQHVPLPRWNAK